MNSGREFGLLGPVWTQQSGVEDAKTAVLRPFWRGALGTDTSELWCVPFVVWKHPDLDVPVQRGPICHLPESLWYAHLAPQAHRHITFAAPCMQPCQWCRMQWPEPRTTSVSVVSSVYTLISPHISLHSLFRSGLWSLDGNLTLREWQSMLITVETDVWKHKTVLALTNM